VAITAEIYTAAGRGRVLQHAEACRNYGTGHRSLVRAAGWEGIDVIRALAGLPISHAPPDLVAVGNPGARGPNEDTEDYVEDLDRVFNR
jgi:hypothetical protein